MLSIFLSVLAIWLLLRSEQSPTDAMHAWNEINRFDVDWSSIHNVKKPARSSIQLTTTWVVSSSPSTDYIFGIDVHRFMLMIYCATHRSAVQRARFSTWLRCNNVRPSPSVTVYATLWRDVYMSLNELFARSVSPLHQLHYDLIYASNNKHLKIRSLTYYLPTCHQRWKSSL